MKQSRLGTWYLLSPEVNGETVRLTGYPVLLLARGTQFCPGTQLTRGESVSTPSPKSQVRLSSFDTRDITMTELEASTSMSQLEAALRKNDINVPEGAVKRLLDERQWIYRSTRVDDLLSKLTEEQLYSVFISEHHITSATRLFEFLNGRRCSVLYGHKTQGKTQFLFFVFKLLQAMGEKALFLDRTILPAEFNKIEIDSDTFCGDLWKNSFRIEGPVKVALNKFLEDALLESFQGFFFELRKYARITQSTRNNQSPQSSKTRVWVIADEVVLFEILIKLPEEQDLGPFKWIVTGSAGIGSWVAKRHLEKMVFDLPPFSKDESFEFAKNLCESLHIDLETAIDGVPFDGIDDWLEERFGGVVGYIAELFLDIADGKLVSRYMSALSDRINGIIGQSLVKSKSKKELAEDWLNEIKSIDNTWACLRDAGLCGKDPPPGIIFSLILKWLYTFYPQEDALRLVAYFRAKFSKDPGLDGCLLELEEILKLIAGKSFEASLLIHNGQEWIIDDWINLPPKGMGSFLNVLKYEEMLSKLDPDQIPSSPPTSSSWSLIKIPSGFDVIDVVLVDSSSSANIYGIQTTRSVNPFAKHHTFDTCPQSSKRRLEKLWNVISGHFGQEFEKLYVMLAPNCESSKFRPSSERHTSAYYFAPVTISGPGPSTSRKRSGHRLSAHSPSSKKKSK